MIEEPQEPSRPLRVLSLALSIFIVAGALLWLSREDGPPPFKPTERPQPVRPPKPPGPEAASTEAPAERDATRRAAELAELAPLPAPEVPLSEQVAVLQERAQAGDAEAGCRLMFVARHCEASTPADGCAGVLPGAASDDALQGALPWLSPRQKTLLAMMRSDGRVARLRSAPHVQAPGFVYPQFLADRAHDFLLEGFRAHDALALEGLAIAHSPGAAVGWGGTGPSLPDPRLFVFYTGVLQRLHGPDTLGEAALALASAARERMTLAQREDLDRKIESEVRAWVEDEGEAPLQAAWQELQAGELHLSDCAGT